MGRSQITGDQVADNTITTDDVKDGSIRREDLDTTTPGQAVVSSIIPGLGISISSTGIDSGTGDVTINSTSGGQDTQLVLISGGRKKKVSGTSGVVIPLDHHGVPMTEAEFYLPLDGQLRWMLLTVEKPDNLRSFQLQLERNGVVVYHETLSLFQTEIVVTTLDIPVMSGRYALTIKKIGNGSSKFRRLWGAVGIQVEL